MSHTNVRRRIALPPGPTAGLALVLGLVLAWAVFGRSAAPTAGAQHEPWARLMDGLQGDVVDALVFTGAPPVTPRSMLLLPRGNGLFRVRADGSGWEPVNVDPDRPAAEVYAVTLARDDEEGASAYAGLRGQVRFARSDDSGRTWFALPGPAGIDRVDRLTTSEATGRVYAARADRDSLWTSLDRGDNWTSHALPGPSSGDAPIDQLFTAPDDPLVYMVRADGLYKTNDDPQSWALALGPNPTLPVTVSLAVDLAAIGPRGRLHAVGSDGGAYIVRSSEDRGETWTAEGWPTEAGAVRPTALGAGEVLESLNGVWLGLDDGRVFRSTDGGATWSLVAELPIRPLTIAVDPDNRDVWVGSDGLGLYRINHTDVHTGAVPVTALAVVAPTYSDDGLVLLNAEVLPERREGLGMVEPPLHAIFESSGGETWTRRLMTVGLGVNLLASPDFTSDQRLFSGRLVSHDAGESWESLPDGPAGAPPYITAVGPITGTQPVLYGLGEPYDDESGTGGSGLALSEDGGATWSTTEGVPTGIVDVAVSPAFEDDRTAFVGTAGGFVYRSVDGRAFQFVGRIPAADPFGRSLYDLAISPDFVEDTSLLAAIEDTASSQRANLYVSNNAGGTWQPRNTGLMTASRPRTLELSPDFGTDRVAFLGGARQGSDPPLPMIYASDAGGADWFIEAFLPVAEVFDFAWAGDMVDGKLFAAVAGAGLWVRDLSDPIGGIGPTRTPTPTTAPPTATPTHTSTPSVTPTDGPSPTPTDGPTLAPSATATAVPATASPIPETPTPSLTPAPTITPTWTPTVPADTPSPEPTATATAAVQPGSIYAPFAVNKR